MELWSSDARLGWNLQVDDDALAGISPRPRPRRRLLPAILAALALAIVVLVLLWDWTWFKGPVERAVQAKTGRAFEIAGNLDVDIGRIVTVTADGVRLGNAAWSKRGSSALTCETVTPEP